MKGILIKGVLAILVASLIPALSFGTSISFDDLTDFNSGNGTDIATASLVSFGTPFYNGFVWSNFDVMNTIDQLALHNPNGYSNNVKSKPNIAFNPNGTPASLSTFFIGGGLFSFTSVYLGAAWNIGLNVEIQGCVNDCLTAPDIIYDRTFTVSALGPASFEKLNYANIDTVKFISSGGTSAGFGASGEEFSMDNAVINGPEPASMALLGTGLASLVGLARRRIFRA